MIFPRDLEGAALSRARFRRHHIAMSQYGVPASRALTHGHEATTARRLVVLVASSAVSGERATRPAGAFLVHMAQPVGTVLPPVCAASGTTAE